jgi:hypothetical protein
MHVFVFGRSPLRQRLKLELVLLFIVAASLKYSLAVCRAVLRRRVKPTPGLAFRPRFQRLGFRGRGFLSRAGELDAGGVSGGRRYSVQRARGALQRHLVIKINRVSNHGAINTPGVQSDFPCHNDKRELDKTNLQ